MAFDTAERRPRIPREEVEVPFEPSRDPLAAVGELAVQMRDTLLRLDPMWRQRATAIFMGVLPLSTEPNEEGATDI